MVDIPGRTPAEVAAIAALKFRGASQPPVGFVGLGERHYAQPFRTLSQTTARQGNSLERTKPDAAAVLFDQTNNVPAPILSASASSKDKQPASRGEEANSGQSPSADNSVPGGGRGDGNGHNDIPGIAGFPDPEGPDDRGEKPEKERAPESITEVNKDAVKNHMRTHLRPIELTDNDYDAVVPISLEEFFDIMDRGIVRARYAFSRERLAENALASENDEDRDVDEDRVLPLFLRPLHVANRLAHDHGVLSELNLSIETPQRNPRLWAAIQRNQNEDSDLLAQHGIEPEHIDDARRALRIYHGILVAVVRPLSEQGADEAIPYTQIRAIMGVGQERADMIAYLEEGEDALTHPALRSYASYTFEGRRIRLEDAMKGRIEGYREQPDAPVEVRRNTSLRHIVDRLKIALRPDTQRSESGTIEEVVFGYLSEPTYQQTTTTELTTVPNLGQIHVFNNTDALITRETIAAFAQAHSDRFDPSLAQQVGDALFNPFALVAQDTSLQLPTRPAESENVAAWEAFSQWKRAGLHLRIFDVPTTGDEPASEQGIAAASIVESAARGRLDRLEGLDAQGQAFLTEMATELTTWTRNEEVKPRLARRIAENLRALRSGVITVFDSETTIVNDASLGPIEVTLAVPMLASEEEALFERGATESEIARGVATIKVGSGESEIVMQEVISDEGGLTLMPVSAQGESGIAFTAEALAPLQTALNIAALIGSYPKLIFDRFGSYSNFRAYLATDEDMRGIELAQEARGDRLYRDGLDTMVNAFAAGGETAMPEVVVAETFVNHFDPESVVV